MIGLRIEGRPGFPIGAVLWLALAVLIAIPAGILDNRHLLLVALLPTAIGLALLLARERPFDADLTSEGVEIEEPPLSLPYAAIQGMAMPGKLGRAQAPIQLFHAGGVVQVPARLNVRSDDLFAFLLEQLPPSDWHDLPPVLAKYAANQEKFFGPERVFSYRARPHRAPSRRRLAITVCIALALAGLAWIAAGALFGKGGEPWIAIGIMVAFLCGIFALAFRPESTRLHIKNWQESGLVISPAGLALIQGDMKGELRWDELRDIRFRQKPGFFDFQTSGAHLGGIQLVVEGAKIFIADLYDRPLALIHKRLRAYWLGGGPNA